VRLHVPVVVRETRRGIGRLRAQGARTIHELTAETARDERPLRVLLAAARREHDKHHAVREEAAKRTVLLDKRDLRGGEFDVLVGINLLREGLDIPEVSLVAILDADKEGFLRSETSLVQTIGRAARNAEGAVIMYADVVTKSMETAITETQRRREIQQKYNEEHGIIPKTIVKEIRDVLELTKKEDKKSKKSDYKKLPRREREQLIARYTAEMKKAAKLLDFEHAAFLRDKIKEISGE